MRIAYFSPLNPVPSGISDYSEDLLPYLGAEAEVDLFIDRGYRPTNAELMAHFAVYPYDRYPRMARRRAYDVRLYHVGNSPAHDYIVSMLERFPGVVVLHDVVLHHLMLWRAVRHGNGGVYRQAMSAYGEAGDRVASRMLAGQLLEEAFEYPLCEGVVQVAQGVIVHSRYAAERVRAIRPDVPLAVVPMGVPLPVLPERAEARRHLGLPSENLVIASFGHVNPYKRLEPALRAFRRLRAEYPDALFLIVGSLSPHLDLPALIARLGLEPAVRVTGFVDFGTFLGYLAACDICINLRYPTAGETSASLLRILGAGIPTLVSRTGAFAELPPEVAIQVDVGPEEEEEIYAFLRYLAGHPEARSFFSEHARNYVASCHTLEAAAAGYLRFLGEWTGVPVPQRLTRPPLFVPPTARPAPVPLASASPMARPKAALALEIIAEALVDVGLREDDESSVRAVTEVLHSLPELLQEETPPGDQVLPLREPPGRQGL
ncbi:MAG: glycosyltransferase family 4 protein [Chloroflexia bacterium]